MLHVGGIMIAVDGYLDSKTAALFEPYSDEPNNSGKLLLTEETLASSVADVLSAGFQPIIHAMGDKAVDIVLESNRANFKTRKRSFPNRTSSNSERTNWLSD